MNFNGLQWNLYYRHYFKDAKRSDFVRNRDMEGDIDMDKVPQCNIMLKLSVNNYDLRETSLITFH